MMIENQFQLVKEIGQGSSGSVWLAIDQSTHQKCAVKIVTLIVLTQSRRIFAKIFELKKRFTNSFIGQSLLVLDLTINLSAFIGFPRFLSSGIDNFRRGYLAIEVLGPSLNKILQHSKQRMSTQTILQLGIQLVSIIRQLHKIGFVHRDLKPDNILLRSFDYSSPESSLISLIDFSASESYLSENGRHVQNERQSTFKGPSRKDDLLSIFYLLLYLKDGQLPWVIKQRDGKIKKMSFDQVTKAKQDFHSLIKMKSQTFIGIQHNQAIVGYGLEQAIIELVQQNGRIFRTIQVL
ncbi:casein kinase i isoform beta [Stylonychia lemnae]|uniref:Casein kinase I n=1 Tax=Stylonychia lemnae TaxID=5949 RepID=A0A078ATT2_STYLE|nr:casein kinase i isoform beta [Stylonychia lemnae]|eukprot:CDW85835.1 casein kinase i isoform beta [Stylonychia lemnae]